MSRLSPDRAHYPSPWPEPKFQGLASSILVCSTLLQAVVRLKASTPPIKSLRNINPCPIAMSTKSGRGLSTHSVKLLDLREPKALVGGAHAFFKLQGPQTRVIMPSVE